jgi:hypothetical protein
LAKSKNFKRFVGKTPVRTVVENLIALTTVVEGRTIYWRNDGGLGDDGNPAEYWDPPTPADYLNMT